jgi:hypothetical protein
MNFQMFYTVIATVIANIISAFLLFLIGFLYTIKSKVKISKKIVKGITEFDNRLHIAYKFKIVNTSRFLKARNFSVKLFAVKKIFNEYEGISTEHSIPVEVKYEGLKELSQYISKRKIRKLMKKRTGNEFSCWYRIITIQNIFNDYKDYDFFRLHVEYKNSLNQEFIVNQYFANNIKKIFIGNFSTDGNIENINPLSEEENNKFKNIL